MTQATSRQQIKRTLIIPLPRVAICIRVMAVHGNVILLGTTTAPIRTARFIRVPIRVHSSLSRIHFGVGIRSYRPSKFTPVRIDPSGTA